MRAAAVATLTSLSTSEGSMELELATAESIAALEEQSTAPQAVHQQKRRRIVFLTCWPTFGGAEQNTIHVMSRLGFNRVQPVIICCEGDPYSRHLTERLLRETEIRRVKRPHGVLGYWRALAKARPYAVCFVDGVAFPFSAYLAARLARGASVWQCAVWLPCYYRLFRSWRSLQMRTALSAGFSNLMFGEEC